MRLQDVLRPFLLFFLLLVHRSCASPIPEGSVNPPIIRLTFRDDGEDGPAEISAPTDHRNQDIPLIYCADSEFPGDVFCNLTELLTSDTFAPCMRIRYVTLDVGFPDHENETCGFQFSILKEEATPTHKKTECGLMRDRPEISPHIVKDGLDYVVEDFAVRNVTDSSIVSYTPGFGCKYRFKPIDSPKSDVKVLKMDSFYCAVNFGTFDLDKVPKMKYPQMNFFKHNGEKWASQGIWPEYY